MKVSTWVRWAVATVGIVVAVTIMYRVGNMALFTAAQFSLNTDSAGRTTALIMGYGGDTHDGTDLTDVLLIASYNHANSTLALLSLPRDLWVTPFVGAGTRINELFETELRKLENRPAALEATREHIAQLIGIPIQYHFSVNFLAVRDVVNALNGVEVLTERINDPQYPCGNLIDFCPFYLPAGYTLLDGDTALKFVRSRMSTSDFDRARRQQLLIEGIIQAAKRENVLSKPSVITSLMQAFRDNTETNISEMELIAVANIAREITTDDIAEIVLSSTPEERGGILYTPLREEYGGAFVLLSGGPNGSHLELLTRFAFSFPDVVAAKTPIEVLNSTGPVGAAKKTAYFLNRFGIEAARFGNYVGEDIETTTIFYDELEEGIARLVEALQFFIPNAKAMPMPDDIAARGFALSLVLGENFEGLKEE